MTTFHSDTPNRRLWLRDGTEVAFKDGSYRTNDRGEITQLRNLGYEEKRTRKELAAEARRLKVDGRSDMPKEKLEEAVDEAKDDLAES